MIRTFILVSTCDQDFFFDQHSWSGLFFWSALLIRTFFLVNTHDQDFFWSAYAISTSGFKKVKQLSPLCAPPPNIGDFRGGCRIRKYFLNYVSYWHDSKFHMNFIDDVIWKIFFGSCRNFYRPLEPHKGKRICQKWPKNGIFRDFLQKSKNQRLVFARKLA